MAKTPPNNGTVPARFRRCAQITDQRLRCSGLMFVLMLPPPFPIGAHIAPFESAPRVGAYLLHQRLIVDLSGQPGTAGF
jgi:hypothetical protein